MEELVFPAQINVMRRAACGPALLLLMALVIVALFMIMSLLRGNRQWIYFLAVLPVLTYGVMRLSSVRKPCQVLATLRMSATQLELALPGTRLSEEGYIDQLYVSALEDVECVQLGRGELVLTSRHLIGLGLAGGRLVARDELGYGDVMLTIDNESAGRIEAFLCDSVEVVHK